MKFGETESRTAATLAKLEETEELSKGLTRLGVCTCLFGQPSSLTIEQAHALRKSGIEYLELSASAASFYIANSRLADSAKSLLGDHSVKVNTVHMPFSTRIDISTLNEEARAESLEEARKTIDLLLEFEGEALVVHPSSEPISDAVRPARLEQCERSLEEMVEACRKKKVKLAVENLPRTCLGNTSAEMLRLIEGFDPEIAGVCLDTNHINLRENLADSVKRTDGRLFALHVSDNDGQDKKHWFPFDGVIEWKQFLEALTSCQYDGVFMYELGAFTVDSLKALRRAKRNFAKMQALLG